MPESSSQFRSRDVFRQLVAALARGDETALGPELTDEAVPPCCRRPMFTLRYPRVTKCNQRPVRALAVRTVRRPTRGATEVQKGAEMALLAGTLSRAGPLSSDILDLQVAKYGPNARVVTVVGEIDALSAPELAAFLTVQLVDAQVVVVNLDSVRFLASAGLRALFEANAFATREGRDLRLVCNSQTANWALETSGLREHFTFAHNMPRSAGPRQPRP